MRVVKILCLTAAVLTILSGLIGIFSFAGSGLFTVENIYGESIELYGKGIYEYNSVLKAGANKGTDLVMIIAALVLIYSVYNCARSLKHVLIMSGTLAGILYYSAFMAFGVTFNRLFPVYVMIFSSSLFAMIILMDHILNKAHFPEKYLTGKVAGTGVFLLICACSPLIWLEYIIPSVITGRPMSIIEIYTTEVTFVLDLAIVLPIFVFAGSGLLKGRPSAYKLAPMLLIFMIIIGLTVISQNMFQTYMGVEIAVQQFLILVVTFIVLGAVSGYLLKRLLKAINT